MYTQAFESAVNHAMLYEVGGSWNLTTPGVIDGTNLKACGYGNDPTDRGGETKYGIAKAANPDVDILNLDWEGAKAIYYRNYWLAGSCDKLAGRIGALHFDGCMNHGVGRAAKFLQRAISATDDGNIGPASIASANKANPIVVCQSICNQRVKYYNDIVKQAPAQVKYLKGWTRRIEEMRVFSTNPNGKF